MVISSKWLLSRLVDEEGCATYRTHDGHRENREHYSVDWIDVTCIKL